MKKNVNKRDLFASQSVLDSLGMNSQVNIVDDSANGFRDWGKHFDIFHEKMVSGTAADNHAFLVKSNRPTTMMIFQCMGPDEELNPDGRDFVKKGTDGPK